MILQLNPTFIANIRDLYKEAGEAWIKNLPDLVTLLSRQWNFRFVKSMPNLTYHFVGLVETEGRLAILKIAHPKGAGSAEPRWLSAFQVGVPTVYAVDESHCAFLMEYLQPGVPLKLLAQSGEDDQATRVICRVIRGLHSSQNIATGFKHLSELSGDLDSLRGRFDSQLLSKAKSLFQELTADRTRDSLLHGDLHHENILSSGSNWKAIDPHGYIGDPAFEVGPMIYNALDVLPQGSSLSDVIAKRLQILTEELPFDPWRIHAWAFCMTVLSIAWSVQDHGVVPTLQAEVASILARIRF